jgi:hypothetical protein
MGRAVILSIATVVLAADSVSAQTSVDPACDPTAQTFTTIINNQFFPLASGDRWLYEGKDGADVVSLRITVFSETETFYSDDPAIQDIPTVQVQETEWIDADGDGKSDKAELLEVSVNFFAQTTEGTVCYFGETVDIYENGKVVSNEGAWRADEGDNFPGIFMPADPQVGDTFLQEGAPGVAEDTATIVSEDKTVRTPAGTFTNTIGVRDFNPLDGSRSTKAYASGVGLVVDDKLLLLESTRVP